MADETCRAYEVDGEPVRVHGGAPLTDEGQAALAEVVRAAKQHMAEKHPHAGVIQELVSAAQHASWCIPEGLVQSRGRNRLMDSFEVRMRLKAAVQAARVALTPKATAQGLVEDVHPGEILRGELRSRNMTQAGFAESTGRPAQVINEIINGKKSVTADTALDFERELGIEADFWVRAQADHDLYVARRRRGVSR